MKDSTDPSEAVETVAVALGQSFGDVATHLAADV